MHICRACIFTERATSLNGLFWHADLPFVLYFTIVNYRYIFLCFEFVLSSQYMIGLCYPDTQIFTATYTVQSYEEEKKNQESWFHRMNEWMNEWIKYFLILMFQTCMHLCVTKYLFIYVFIYLFVCLYAWPHYISSYGHLFNILLLLLFVFFLQNKKLDKFRIIWR